MADIEKENGPVVNSVTAIDSDSANLPPSYDAHQSPSAEEIKKEKFRIYRNVLLISLAFFFNFTSFGGLSRLQSSLHRIEGMGTTTLAVLYGSLMLSCMFLPTLIIRFIGHRWTITASFSGYILYMAANGYAVWGTMITASILVGICAAPLWTAQCSYFTIIGARYARFTGVSVDSIVSRFFGIFFFFFQLSSIFGSIISATILKPVLENPNDTFVEIDLLGYCGANDCPWNNDTNPNLVPPAESTVWTMVGVYIAVACCAVVIVGIFVDNLRPDDLPEESQDIKTEVKKNFIATFTHLRHKEQWIIIPLTMYSGFEQAFFSAEFSKSFVTCTVGIWKVGLVTLPFGVCNATMSFFGGYIARYVGRIPLFLLGMCIDLCTQFTLMFWSPVPEEEYVLYILASMWGITDGIWQTQINTLYGIIFAKESEAAFSNYRMWESLGFIIAFAYSASLCTSVKLYVLTSVLGVGMVGYFIVEYLHKKGKVDPVEHKLEANHKSPIQDNAAFTMSTSAAKLDDATEREAMES